MLFFPCLCVYKSFAVLIFLFFVAFQQTLILASIVFVAISQNLLWKQLNLLKDYVPDILHSNDHEHVAYLYLER